MKRDYFLDNYKVFLITLVVLTHFTGAFAHNTGFFKAFSVFTNTFYMPAFIIISGYLSKHNDTTKLIKTLLIPYVIFQILNIILNVFVIHSEDAISLLNPAFTLWYLLALFCWRMSIRYLGNIKYILPISILFSLLIGFDVKVGGFLSVSRIIYFFPFFVFGYLLNLEKLKTYRRPIIQMASILGIILCIVIIWKTCGSYKLNLFRGSTSYIGLNDVVWGWAMRLFLYIVAFYMSFSFAMIIPEKKFAFTSIGDKTMSIYLFHGLLYRYLYYGTAFYTYLKTPLYRILFMGCLVFLVYILSTKPFCIFMKKVSGVPIEKLYKKRGLSNE